MYIMLSNYNERLMSAKANSSIKILNTYFLYVEGAERKKKKLELVKVT